MQLNQINFRLLAAPLIIEGSEKRTIQCSETSGSLTLASLELVECLVDNSTPNNASPATFIEVLTFIKDSIVNTVIQNKMDFEMRFKYIQKAIRQGQVTRYSNPRTEFK